MMPTSAAMRRNSRLALGVLSVMAPDWPPVTEVTMHHLCSRNATEVQFHPERLGT